jgi:hypothetical protein
VWLPLMWHFRRLTPVGEVPVTEAGTGALLREGAWEHEEEREP